MRPLARGSAADHDGPAWKKGAEGGGEVEHMSGRHSAADDAA